MRTCHCLKKISAAKLKGSFTIEAAVVIPITMFIMLALILLSFYIHDKTLMVTAPVSAILENANDSSDISALQQEAASRINPQLIAAGSPQISVESNDNTCSLSCSAGFDWRNNFVRTYLNDSLGNLATRVNITNLDGRQVLLLEKVLSDAAQKIKGDE